MTTLAFSWPYLWDHTPELLHGLVRTLETASIGIAIAFAVGLLLGAARAHRIPVVSQLAVVYVELIRNTPLLVQIFFIFYGLPRFDIRLDPFTTTWVAVSIWGGAFNTENFRAGFLAVPARYREAGSALGFGSIATFLNVTLPIGGRIAIPASINTYISVLKNTALVTAIGYPELTNVAYSLNAVDFRAAEVFAFIAVAYLVVVWSFSALIRFVEARLRLPETV